MNVQLCAVETHLTRTIMDALLQRRPFASPKMQHCNAPVHNNNCGIAAAARLHASLATRRCCLKTASAIPRHRCVPVN